jgi:hypothetical protein
MTLSKNKGMWALGFLWQLLISPSSQSEEEVETAEEKGRQEPPGDEELGTEYVVSQQGGSMGKTGSVWRRNFQYWYECYRKTSFAIVHSRVILHDSKKQSAWKLCKNRRQKLKLVCDHILCVLMFAYVFV